MEVKKLEVFALFLAVLGLATSIVFVGRSQPASAFGSGDSSQSLDLVSTPSNEEAGQKILLSTEIQSMFLAKEKELLKPGWLHIVYKTSLRPDVSRGDLTEGVPFPSEYIIEDWFLLDEENYVVEAVTFMRDLDGGALLQKSIFIDGTWINTTLNDKVTVGEFKPSIDGGLLTLAIAGDTVLDKYEIRVDDQKMIVYEMKNEYQGSEKNIQQIVTRLYFSANGDFVESETVLVENDGSEVFESATKFLVMENVSDPAADVIEYYSEVKK